MFRSCRKTKKEKKKNKTRNFVRVFLSSRKFDTATDDINLPLPRGEGEEEWSSARKSMRSHFNIRPKHRGEKVGNKAIPGKFWILVALRWHYWPATARCIIPSIINSTDIADYFVHRAIAIHLGFPSLCSLAASQFPPRYLLKKVPESYQSSPF